MIPKISIVLPVHNGMRFLPQAIRSVQEQTCRDWELIIVDDASSDRTPEIIIDACRMDERIRSVRHEQNRRLPAALNTGFALARGEYLTWTSDDNLYRPEALCEMAAVLDMQAKVDIVYAGRTYIDDNGCAIQFQPAEPPELMADHNPVGACFLFRRCVHESLGGYDEKLFLVEDYDFWLRASCWFRYLALNKDLYFYRHHEASLTGTRRDEIIATTDHLLECRIPGLGWLGSKTQVAALLTVSERYRRRADLDAARRVGGKALKCAPFAFVRNEQAVPITALLLGYRAAQLLAWWQSLIKTNSEGKGAR